MRFAAGARRGLAFEPFQASGAGGRGIGQAASMATLGSTFQTMRAKAPQYGKFGAMGVASQGAKARAAQTASAKVFQAGVTTAAKTKATQIQADGIKAAAAKRAQGAMMGSALSAVGSIGAALLSDESTKNNIVQLENGLELLRKLRPVSFYYNSEYTDEPERRHYGFIAQEYSDVMPNQTYFDTHINKLCIDTTELIAVLVKSIQQLERRLEVLER